MTTPVRYLRRLSGTEAANNLLQRITKQLKTKSFDFVRKADYKNLLAIVQNEHPQTIALILSYARIDQAAGYPRGASQGEARRGSRENSANGQSFS